MTYKYQGCSEINDPSIEELIKTSKKEKHLILKHKIEADKHMKLAKEHAIISEDKHKRLLCFLKEKDLIEDWANHSISLMHVLLFLEKYSEINDIVHDIESYSLPDELKDEINLIREKFPEYW